MSVEKIIYEHLKGKSIPVYFPGQAKGDVTSPRVVVKSNVTNQFNNFSTTLTTYDILVYVPKDSYSTLTPYVDSVKEYMKELQPAIMPTYFETASFLDDTVNGHMISIQYRNYKKL